MYTNNTYNAGDDRGSFYVRGFLKVYDPESSNVYYDGPNAIHYENISEAMALMLANKSSGFIEKMKFGNGGTSVDPTGVISYLPANSTGLSADLYNPTYEKIVDNTSALNADPIRNKMDVRHTPGQVYTDIVVSCLLDYGEPAGQEAFDSASSTEGRFVFDELGLWSGGDHNKLLTHVIFHPIQKSLNRLIQIDYTVRIQTLTNLSTIL